MLMTYLQTVYIIKDKLQRHSLGVQALLKLFTFRNQSVAFDLDGSIDVEILDENTLVITRRNQGSSVVAEAQINLKELSYAVKENGEEVTFL